MAVIQGLDDIQTYRTDKAEKERKEKEQKEFDSAIEGLVEVLTKFDKDEISDVVKSVGSYTVDSSDKDSCVKAFSDGDKLQSQNALDLTKGLEDILKKRANEKDFDSQMTSLYEKIDKDNSGYLELNELKQFYPAN
eukprot:UN26693